MRIQAPEEKIAKRGFTLVELLVVIFIIIVVVALLLPATRNSREAARRMSCSNNVKNLGLALHTYHDAHGHFPAAMGGTGAGSSPLLGNADRLSGWVALLPYIEQQPLSQQITNPMEIDGVKYPAMGPAPWVSAYPPWQTQIALLQCPGSKQGPSDFGWTNYAFCIGDLARQVHQPAGLRGVFGCGLTSRMEDISDGLSYTIAIAEIGTPSGARVVGQFATNQAADLLRNPSLCRNTIDGSREGFYAATVPLSKNGRGGRWADGAAGYSLVNTILPPNSPSCAIGGLEAADGIYSAGSEHPGGVMVLKADATVAFISERIDASDSSHPTPTLHELAKCPLPSPYGVWGAMGTAAGEEEAK